jgi:hypothetical protein
MTAVCPTKVFAVPASNPSRYNDKMKTCHPRAMANQARTRILINKQRFSRNFHRFFRGRDSMKENRRIAAFRCIGILTLGYFSSVPDLLDLLVPDLLPDLLKPSAVSPSQSNIWDNTVEATNEPAQYPY